MGKIIRQAKKYIAVIISASLIAGSSAVGSTEKSCLAPPGSAHLLQQKLMNHSEPPEVYPTHNDVVREVIPAGGWPTLMKLAAGFAGSALLGGCNMQMTNGEKLGAFIGATVLLVTFLFFNSDKRKAQKEPLDKKIRKSLGTGGSRSEKDAVAQIIFEKWKTGRIKTDEVFVKAHQLLQQRANNRRKSKWVIMTAILGSLGFIFFDKIISVISIIPNAWKYRDLLKYRRVYIFFGRIFSPVEKIIAPLFGMEPQADTSVLIGAGLLFACVGVVYLLFNKRSSGSRAKGLVVVLLAGIIGLGAYSYANKPKPKPMLPGLIRQILFKLITKQFVSTENESLNKALLNIPEARRSTIRLCAADISIAH